MAPSERSKKLGVALLGFGRMGSIMAQNCLGNSEVNLKYIVELNCNAAEKFIEENGDADTKFVHGDNFQSVLDDESVDAVIVATVTHTHEALVLQSIAAKKAVLCEKPLANSYEATVACFDAAEKAGVPLLVAFNRRFDPTHRSTHDAVRAGKIGDVHVVKTCSRDNPLPSLDYIRVSGGIFHDCAIHDVDMVMWMMGKPPRKVYAQAHAFIPDYAGSVGDVDTVAINMQTECGALGIIDISRRATYGYDQRVEVFGSQGMVQSNNVPKTATVLSCADGVTGDVTMHSFPTRFAEAYVIELQHFVDLVGGRVKPIVTRKSTLLAQRVTAACERSYKTGQPVELTDDELNV